MALKLAKNIYNIRLIGAKNTRLGQFYLSSLYSSASGNQNVIKEEKTPLGKELESIIKSGGPISLHKYISLCNTHPKFGYYNAPEAIGPKGSFVTSPEISQLFGEMVALWLFTQWESNGCPQKVRFIEFGPGNGTLLNDILRTLKRFPKFFNCLEEVNLVEMSSTLATKQAKSWVDPSLDGIEFGKSIKHPQHNQSFTWYNHFDDLYTKCYEDKQTFTFLIAHEFLDALPIRRFKKTEFGFRETLIDIDNSEESPYNFKLIQSKTPTEGNILLTPIQHLYNHLQKDMELELSSDLIQFLPKFFNLISKRGDRAGGLGLVVDYGDNLVKGNSLRGIKDHKFVNILSTPGEVDLSTDVNFKLISQLAMIEQLYPQDKQNPSKLSI
jgi:NADH dehydrogenase [ubiquinone] 1 alpha subcomplex assembly factor 7